MASMSTWSSSASRTPGPPSRSPCTAAPVGSAASRFAPARPTEPPRRSRDSALPRLPQHGEHCIVDPAVARHHRGRLQIERPTDQIRDAPARLLDEEASGGDIPRPQAELPEAVEPTGREPREIEDGEPQPRHAPARDAEGWLP